MTGTGTRTRTRTWFGTEATAGVSEVPASVGLSPSVITVAIIKLIRGLLAMGLGIGLGLGLGLGLGFFLSWSE